MTECGFDKKVGRLPTGASLNWATDWTDELAEEGVGVSIVSATASMTSITSPTRPVPAGVVGMPEVVGTIVTVPVAGAGLIVGDRYRLVVTITSSADNVTPRSLEVHVPF